MPQMSPLVAGDPTQLGSFRLSGRIGEGGQGIVYLGVNESGEQAAVKLLHVKFSGDTVARSRFARELKAAQRVASFCTARVIEADLDGDTPYIASEYIDGRALRDIVESDGPLRGTVLDRLAIGTATALVAIHHASIVHRDLKPDNVLIASDGPRVVDFGIARIIDSTGTITSRAIGTPAYMAPEQIAGDDVGPYTDVFAWGATIAFAATGTSAFDGNSIATVLNKILNHEVDVGMLPEPLRGVVRSALAKSPAERPSADQILLRLLGQPEHAGASTDVLTRGVQVASDDTTPFMRVSPSLAERATTGTGATGHPPHPEAAGLALGETGSGPYSEAGSRPYPGTGSGPYPGTGSGVFQVVAGEPRAVAPARGGRGTRWAVLAGAVALVAAVVAAVVLKGWPVALGDPGPDPTAGTGKPPEVYTSVMDKIGKSGKIVIGVKDDLPGIGLLRDGEFEGFDVDLAKEIAAKLGAAETKFVAVSRANRADKLARGDVDLVVATYSVSGEDVTFAGPYYLAHQDVLVRQGPIDELSDLKGKKICGINSPSVGMVQDKKVEVEPVPAGDYAECMDLLRSGEVDAVPGEDLVLAGFAAREHQRYKILGARLSDERYAVGLRKGDVKTCKAVNGVIADLYRTKAVHRLLERHFGTVEFATESKVPAMNDCG
ncbi:bifunctional serine/threonine-protein kinase/glutamate ABC transporter substrate-binding protein [Nonomuraea sp. SBT364]|uniref:bifunctional serine/threonine-protein kinase/glutamate ABC transporter substrate-binding protein n=1 Tax=Nonomuraea sp. SBT364 TaxID=1580530 RepID=UPI00069CF24B|nr:bifunctional serine/threonine-protein kinase/glutamate ABC transporter substrate-binding protein [Nonomuraea sp. SBT364]